MLKIINNSKDQGSSTNVKTQGLTTLTTVNTKDQKL